MPQYLQTWVWGFVVCIALFGCAEKRPQTVTLDQDQQRAAGSAWDTFIARSTPAAIDADVTLTWGIFGSKGNIGGIMQLQRQSLLKLSAIDPLGRAIFLLTTDGETFTFIDIRQQKVYRGNVRSTYWQKYIPASVQPAEIFDLLAGRVPVSGYQLIQSRGDVENRGYWYELKGNNDSTHYILLDVSGERMLSHLLLDAKGITALDVRYDGYQEAVYEMSWPSRVEISGRGVDGTYSLAVKKIYSHRNLPKSTFTPKYPPHFDVKRVE